MKLEKFKFSLAVIVLFGYFSTIALPIGIIIIQNFKTSQPKQFRQIRQHQIAQVPVRLLEVQIGGFKDSSDYIGVAKSRCSAVLRPKIEGKITRIAVAPGNTVAAGDLIIQVESTKQQRQPERSSILAPCSGIVGNISASVGNLVDTSTELTTVTNINPLDIAISISTNFGLERKLLKGMPVELIKEGQSLGTVHVSFISPVVESKYSTIFVVAPFDNSKSVLRANEAVIAKVIWDQRPGVIVPSSALVPVAGEHVVYVAQTQQSEEGKPQLVARQKHVRLVDSIMNSDYLVIEGLQPKDKIIVSGISNLRDGSPIIPE